jgi:hypothetical protein
MKELNQAASTLVITALTTMNVVAAEPSDGLATAALSTETLLVQEMQAITEAMGRIHAAVVTGDHATVVEEARDIHDSFVLAQKLTNAQRTEISATLPAAFVAADRAFHGLAEKLMHAGEQSDPGLERFWLQEMTRACQACHKEHASARFPGLAPQDQ